mmetsp:Transcript_20564/g.31353  ORF Transcript_20564/g.31353 Transcript_20564/m.31353 type:complete len:95 (+) Transcript_20564:2-286(+)
MFNGRKVSYQIVWVDDVTFMVAADCGDQQDVTRSLQSQGPMIANALNGRFPNSRIITMQEHLASLQKVVTTTSIWSKLYEFCTFAPSKKRKIGG